MNNLTDNNITLNEKWHSYKLKSDPYFRFRSATQLVGKYFEPFNAQKISKELCENHPKYENTKPEDLVIEWKGRANYGTMIHKEIESGLLYDTKPVEKKSQDAIDWINNYTDNFKTPIKCEQIIYCKEWNVAGSIDVLVGDSEFEIIDWKTAKNISMSSFDGKMGNHKITEKIEDCNFNHYALQLSIYRLILEYEYGIKVTNQMIVHVTDEGCFKFDTPYYEEESNQIIKNERK